MNNDFDPRPLPLPTTPSRTKLMIEKLYDQAARGCIDNLWAEDFIDDMKEKLSRGEAFTEKQLVKIEELFERY